MLLAIGSESPLSLYSPVDVSRETTLYDFKVCLNVTAVPSFNFLIFVSLAEERWGWGEREY